MPAKMGYHFAAHQGVDTTLPATLTLISFSKSALSSSSDLGAFAVAREETIWIKIVRNASRHHSAPTKPKWHFRSRGIEGCVCAKWRKIKNGIITITCQKDQVSAEAKLFDFLSFLRKVNARA
jgi:hypothetical protein